MNLLDYLKEKLLPGLILGLVVALFSAYMDLQLLKQRVQTLEIDNKRMEIYLDQLWKEPKG